MNGFKKVWSYLESITETSGTRVFDQLSHGYAVEKKTISKEAYDRFCQEYIFSKLRGINFGEAFCREFDIIDYVLVIKRDEIRAKQHIREMGYVK